MIDRYLGPGLSAVDHAAREIGISLTPSHREHVAHEQMRMVLLHTRMGTLAATAFAVLLALYLQSTAPGLPVFAWLAVKLALSLARITLAQAYVRNGARSAQWQHWQRAMLALLAADGLVWGVAGLRLMAEPVPVAALAVATLDGIGCVATFGLQVRLAATAAYVVPILLPVALGLALRADEIASFAAVGQLILLGLLLLTARATSRQLAGGMLLRLQADRLVAEKDAALQLAQERSAERDRFLAKVSHELRTPLHGMLGLTRLLHLDAQDAQDATASHRLELIESSGTHLLGLINDLLEVSRIGAGHFALHEEAFDLAALIDEVAELYALRAADKGLRFSLQVQLPRPCWVHGDAARLRQVLTNLLGNAVKFTRQGGVTLSVGPGAGPDRVRLAVIDTGVGIGAAEQSRIFQPFHQAAAGAGPAQATDGVGLGLTIAREIALAMGGDIELRSAPGAGSTFGFEARLPPAAAVASAGATPPAGPRLPRLVLVAEDDEVNALIVGGFLDGLGVRCERVADGRQAVSQALREADRPELVLMDCRMPVMDGMTAAAEIRRQERTLGLRRLPIVALTATTTDVELQACLAVGMDAVIAKPFTPTQLAQALHAAAARHG